MGSTTLFNPVLNNSTFFAVYKTLKPKRYLRGSGILHLSELSLFENQPAVKGAESGCENCKFLNIFESYIHISAPQPAYSAPMLFTLKGFSICHHSLRV